MITKLFLFFYLLLVHGTEDLYTFKRGRSNKLFPTPSCCVDEVCIENRGKNAILTTLRSENYFPLLYSLACSIRQSNPGVQLVVATVRGDLSHKYEEAILRLGNFVKLVHWKEYGFKNTSQSRYTNWVKLRAWEMEEYDSLLMVDTETVILRDITHLFNLPTNFATTLDANRKGNIHNSLGRMQGGVVFLRPCLPVAKHMMAILESYPALRFIESTHGAINYLDWYFLDSRWALPGHYNANSNFVRPKRGTIHGGDKVTILRYVNDKPFRIDEKKHPMHRFAICNESDTSLYRSLGIVK
jgi:lipopolysaccharide biosynthesis glycosyltransferase